MRASYGDVVSEYRALTESAGLVEPAPHDLVWVAGPDAVSFLQGLLSQEVEGLEVGTVARSFLLDPSGKLVALFWLLRGEDRVGLVCDAGLGSVVAERLGFYRIRVKAEISLDSRPAFELWGPRAPALAGMVEGWRVEEGALAAVLPTSGIPWILVVGGAVPEGVTRTGALALTAVRVEDGEPVVGRDVDASTLPHETGLVYQAVSFTKGCFVGYELVERMEARRANPPRRLMGVAVTRNVIPPEGAEVWSGGDRIGRLTSVAESLGVGAPVGLILAKRGARAGQEVRVRWPGGEAPAVLRDLPMMDRRRRIA